MKTRDLVALAGLAAALAGGLVVAPGCGDQTTAAHGADEHEAHGAAEHTGEENGEHEDVVRLSEEQLERAGVVLAPIGRAEIRTVIWLPAEVGLNEDAVVHVTPRAVGVVTEVRGFLGRAVAPGEVLAVLASPDLGEAKIAFLQAAQARAGAEAQLERQRTKSENTTALLGMLRARPSPDELVEATSGLRVGEEKGRLLSAYAKLHAAEANYARERELSEKGLATQADLLAAQEAFGAGRAAYLALLEEVDFTFHTRLEEAERAARVAVSGVENAERRLHLLGLSEEQVAAIATEPDADVARYELLAPARGRIVAKHLSPGERVGAEEAVYTIADLSTVWLDISVSTEYMGLIAEGQSVVVREDEREAAGVVDYVSAIVSEGTRTVSARVVVDNADRAWRPGEFVTVQVEVGRSDVGRAVPVGAVQSFEGREVVFVADGEGIRPVPVTLGRRDDALVELVGDGPVAGARVVTVNSFLIKSELGKGAAGHDH